MSEATGRPSRLRLAVGAITGVLTGLLAALLAGAAMDEERGRSVAGYALGVLPLAALVGASAAGWLNRYPAVTGSRQLLGALLAGGAAVVVSLALGALRFRVAGATGFIAVGALWYTAEFLMVVALLPATAALGVAAARRWGTAPAPLRHGLPPLLGATVALVAGPTVIAVVAAGSPLAVTGLTVAAIVALRVRLP